MSTSAIHDCIVVGAGIIGCSATYYLTKQGKDVLLLEQFPLPHNRGSSHGQTRAIRKSYTQREYSDMMGEAYRRWHQLERECGEQLIK